MYKYYILGFACALSLTGCATPQVVLKTTASGGDAYPRVQVGPASKVETTNLNMGDTIAYAPGSMRAVVASDRMTIRLLENANTTKKELQQQLVMNRRDTSKIELMKGKYSAGDIYSNIDLDLGSYDPDREYLELLYVAFNRGEKPFRGDLTLYDVLPPELTFISAQPAVKYRDQRGTKDALMILPYINLIAMNMSSFKQTEEAVEMEHEALDHIHKYTFKRALLEPGEAVGFFVRLKYNTPTPEELVDLRMDARPAGP